MVVAAWIIRRTAGLLLLTVALLTASVSIAHADGDPASDYLIGNQVFLTSQSITVSPGERELRAVVGAANRAGFGIRVAVISNQYDLGSITALWHKPGTYARFLGLELSSAYRQRLLVVMPDGFGFNWAGHSAVRLPAAPQRAVVAGGDGPSVAAQAAVRRLAAAAGVRLALSAQASGPSPRGRAAPTCP